MNSKEWKIEYRIPEVPKELTDAGYAPLLSYILSLRGVKTAAGAKEMLNADASSLLDPMLIKNMDKAVERLNLACDRGEKIAVYGDYDVDGITATCLMTDYLRMCGMQVTPYIPDRSEEGYGLNFAALDSFADEGISLVITVDCGITAIEEADYARSIGIDMIITDHHECKPDQLPDACAVIDCKQPGDDYPNKNLAGVGMSFKLVSAFDGDSAKILEKYADLVAIGTVADVMPLTGENRCFVKTGLQKIKSGPRPGIAALFREAAIDINSFSASSIGFTLAPRINAAGRLGQALTAFNLLMAEDDETASALATELCNLNRKRQDIENEIWHAAASMLSGKKPDGPIILSSSEWHQGVIGIAASRLAEQYSVPTVMIFMNEDGIGKGSCRSYGNFNLFDALSACSDSLISFGGHALAAGLNIEERMLSRFREQLKQYYDSHKPEVHPEINCDLLISNPQLLSEANVRSLDLLEPFGNCNSKPVFAMCGVLLESFSGVGGNKHTRMRVNAGGTGFDCIFFSRRPEDLGVEAGQYIDLAFTPQINEFHGKTSVQLNIADIRPHEFGELCLNILDGKEEYLRAASAFIPDRADSVRIWKTINHSLGDCLEDILSSLPFGMLPEMYCLGLKIFEDSGLLSGIFGGHVVKLESKADLETTELMRKLRELL